MTKKKSKKQISKSVIEGIRYEETPVEDVSNKAVLKSLLGSAISDGKGSDSSSPFRKKLPSQSKSRRRSVASKRGRTKS